MFYSKFFIESATFKDKIKIEKKNQKKKIKKFKIAYILQENSSQKKN